MSVDLTPMHAVQLVFLFFLSALFSGLNLGLMAMDSTSLVITEASGKPKERHYARNLHWLRSQGNWLLATLLTGNTLVNAIIAILLASVSSSLEGTIMSTLGILFFGEITPQAICSRHGLVVGYYTRHIIYVAMAVFSWIAWPIGKTLDCVMGREVANVYNREGLLKLLEIQGVLAHSEIQPEELGLLRGALFFGRKSVADVATPMSEVYALKLSDELDMKRLQELASMGYSRVPIVDDATGDICAVLLTKALIVLDPNERLSVRECMRRGFTRQALFLEPDVPLNEALTAMQQCRVHLAVVLTAQGYGGQSSYSSSGGGGGGHRRQSSSDTKRVFRKPTTTGLSSEAASSYSGRYQGIITMDNMVEEVLQMTIEDETDWPSDFGGAGAVGSQMPADAVHGIGGPYGGGGGVRPSPLARPSSVPLHPHANGSNSGSSTRGGGGQDFSLPQPLPIRIVRRKQPQSEQTQQAIHDDVRRKLSLNPHGGPGAGGAHGYVSPGLRSQGSASPASLFAASPASSAGGGGGGGGGGTMPDGSPSMTPLMMRTSPGSVPSLGSGFRTAAGPVIHGVGASLASSDGGGGSGGGGSAKSGKGRKGARKTYSRKVKTDGDDGGFESLLLDIGSSSSSSWTCKDDE